jgi:thiol-disulfide isomerase/thioredoxin
MKRFLILFASLALVISVNAQQDANTVNADTLAPYQKTAFIPSFSIQTPDSSWFSKVNLKSKKPTLILYFSPDCGHCQSETEEILTKMKELNDLQIVMVTSRPFEDMKNFSEHYKLDRFPAIKVGTDPARLVTRFYDVKFTPFSALYDKKGKLVNVYKNGIKMDEIIIFLNKRS